MDDQFSFGSERHYIHVESERLERDSEHDTAGVGEVRSPAALGSAGTRVRRSVRAALLAQRKQVDTTPPTRELQRYRKCRGVYICELPLRQRLRFAAFTSVEARLRL